MKLKNITELHIFAKLFGTDDFTDGGNQLLLEHVLDVVDRLTVEYTNRSNVS